MNEKERKRILVIGQHATDEWERVVHAFEDAGLKGSLTFDEAHDIHQKMEVMMAGLEEECWEIAGNQEWRGEP